MAEHHPNTDSQRNRRLETISTIILATATVLSSWCAFQASQWNGEQYFRIDDENIADNKRLQQEIIAVQRRAGETNFFMYYLEAMADKNVKRVAFLASKFPPHLKVATDKWLETDPLNNPDAPKSPFQMKEYIIPELEEAKQYALQAAEFKKQANEADRTSDNYLFLSIIISMALFFTGLSGITDSRRYQRMLLIVPTVIIAIVLVQLIRMPILI
jgi:hypothetical protein